MELRDWQKRALVDLADWSPTGDTGFLVEATPGAGKTRFAIAAAQELLSSGQIDRIVIAVPTARLEGQWSEKFAEVGITINPDWHASTGVLPADEQGCAATYAEIARSSAVFRTLVSRKRTLVILDEVHHCADERSWGAGIRDAFGPAVLKILLSGTPFRSDNNEIPFVNYVDGAGTPDHRYGYEAALADGVVRAVFFPRRGGRTEWSYNGQARSASFDDQLSDQDANRRLRTAIAANGQWLPSVLTDADRQLMELRESDPSAGGIVFCEHSESARAVARMLEQMGRSVTLAISDEPDSLERISKFGSSSTPWLVSIRQVSEGVDIPRLRVGAYATNYLTEMFFRQAVGRLVRVRPDEEDSTAYLYIPDDERLRAMAENIKIARDHVLNQKTAQQTGDGSGGGGALFDVFQPIHSIAEDRGVIVDSGTITPAQLAEAERVKGLRMEYATLPTALVARLLHDAGHFTQSAPPDNSQLTPSASRVDVKKDLTKANNATSRRVAMSTATDFSHVNAGLNRAVGVKSIKQCTEVQLRRRLELAQQWLQSGHPPEGVA